ncbi:hypothetical protein Ami103574_11650 [Aminipila butyrica]|uniref:Type II secretion system protein GspF domain-containing protein n=1 Tax=Aminipila butyrica TaxID=433296 RepID=A0A858BXW2_9FIRM|nr:hypothetical protein [Aminipila butyrica]QIB69935.1 hypothetical protein Ami103574_11650 [Aminipila butyrica]
MEYGMHVGAIGLICTGSYLLCKREADYLRRGALRWLEEPVQSWGKRLRSRLESWDKQRKRQLVDKEIYEGISFLRNVISIDRGKQVSTDFILEQLAEREGVLQACYIRMLSLLRLNRRGAAQQVMADYLETPIGKEFAGLLLRWDEMDPMELSEVLLSHQRSIKEIRMTQQRRRDEIISDLLYFPVIINVVLIFINFIYVGYFINQKEILQMLF